MPTRKSALLAVLLVLLGALALAPSAGAFEARTGEDLIVGANEVVEDDLYLAGSTVRVDGEVQGDLIAVGQTIIVNGRVEGDLLAAGQAVTIAGTVADDARVTGAVLTLSPGGQVGDDVIAAGYTFDAAAGSRIGGSFLFGGSAARLAGEVAEDVKTGVGGLELSGLVGGDVVAEVGGPEDVPPVSPFAFMPGGVSAPSIAGGLTVASSARIDGSLDYRSPQQFEIPSGTVAGATEFQQQVIEQSANQRPSLLARILPHVRRAVALLLVGLLLLWLAPDLTRRAIERLQSDPLPSLGWGLVVVAGIVAALFLVIFVTILVAVIFGFVTLSSLATTSIFIGVFALFALALLFGLAASYLTKVIVSYFGGRWILARLSPQGAPQGIWSLLLGVLLLTLLLGIPIVGGLLSLLTVVFGLGALWLLGRDLWRGEALAQASA